MVLVVGFAWAYDEVRALHGNVSAIAIRHAQSVLRADRFVHMNWSPTMNRWVSHHDPVADFLAAYYVVMHLGVVALVLLLLYVQGPHYRQQRNVLIFLCLVGFLVYWFYPVAPPRLANANVHDTVATVLPFAYSAERASANLYAAVPSLHMAWALWATVAVWAMTTRWTWRTLAALHPVLTAVTVLATGNHYTTDVVTGLALTAICYPAYLRLERLAGSVVVRRKLPRQRLDLRGAHGTGLIAGHPTDRSGDLVRRPEHGLADRR